MVGGHPLCQNRLPRKWTPLQQGKHPLRYPLFQALEPRLLLPSADAGPGQTQEGGTRGHHAQTFPHPEHGDPGPDPLAEGPCVNGARGLTRNTVAEQLQ